MRALVWFRADLRVCDNTALHEACREADGGVVGVFIISPSQWAEHDWGGVKVEFLLRNLRALSSKLEGLNIPLRVLTVGRFDAASAALRKLAEEMRCDALYFNREYELNERRRDDAVRAALERSGRAVHAYTDQTLFAPGEVLTGEGRYYTVFSPFKRAAYRALEDRGGVIVLGTPRKQAEMPCPPDPIPATVRGFDLSRARPDLWPEGEDHAASRLRSFIARRLEPYKDARDLPGINGTSTLSPYLAIGAVSPRRCLRAAMEANGDRADAGGAGAVQWISELLWREFYKHLLIGFPRLSMGRAFKPETERIQWRDDPEGLEAWREGRTGVPIVDAGMRQLAQTGWMHNRLRMITAMYLTKDLLIFWREGERHFMRSLVDGDLAPNNGGWQWSASTGTDAAPYFRIFNPVSQSRKCDPDGAFIRRFVPELAGLDNRAIHEPWASGGLTLARTGYPSAPIVDHATARGRVLEAFAALR